jgi:hypothetical protein
MSWFRKLWARFGKSWKSTPKSQPAPKTPEEKKEHLHLRANLYPMAGDITVHAGEFMLFAKVESEAATRYVCLYMVQKDFEFARECFKESQAYGMPDGDNLHSKAFIYSAVVAYARCFMSGVRQLMLTPQSFDGMTTPAFDLKTHQFLMDVRNKHVAHSVNEFENCRVVAHVIGNNEKGWRDGTAIGVADTRVIGLSGEIVENAIAHIEAIIVYMESQIVPARAEAYKQFAEKFAKDGQWEMAPFGKIPDRGKAGVRRPDDMG